MSQDPYANAGQQPGGQYYDPNQQYQGQQGYPTSASSASYPQSSQSAPYPQSAASAPYPPQGFPQQGYPGAMPPQGSGMMQGLLDFGFKQEATPVIGKVAYYAAWVGGVMWWLGTAIEHFVMSTGEYTSFDTYYLLMGIATLLLGWIPVVGVTILVRVFVEFATATLQNKKTLAEIKQAQSGGSGQ